MLIVHGLPDKYNAATQIAMMFNSLHRFSVSARLMKDKVVDIFL